MIMVTYKYIFIFLNYILRTPLVGIVKHLHPRGEITVTATALKGFIQPVLIRPLPREYASFRVRHECQVSAV